MKIKSLFVLLAILLVACSHANNLHGRAIETSTIFSISTSVDSSQTATIQPTSTARKSTPTPILSATSKASPTQTNTAVPVVPPPPGIVFRTDNGIWIANEYGNKQLPVNIPTDADSMKFCSTGKYILTEMSKRETTGGWSYSTIDVSTGKQVELDPGKDRTFCSVQWWPDSCDTLLVNIEPSADIGRECESFPTILDLNGNFSYISSSEEYLGVLDQPSSDGKLLAYTQEGKPWLYQLGDRSYPIPLDDKVFPGGDFMFFRPNWSPDNKKIAWLVSGNIDDVFTQGIAIFDLEKKEAKFLYPYIAWGGEYPSYLTWNPHHDYILLLPYDDRLRVLNLDGAVQYIVDDVSWYAWSPDGEWLAYSVFTNREQRDIYIRSDNGLAVHEIGSGIGHISWSPDSRYLIYIDTSSYKIVETGIWKSAVLNIPLNAEFVDWINP
jgi:hypothetical protein